MTRLPQAMMLSFTATTGCVLYSYPCDKGPRMGILPGDAEDSGGFLTDGNGIGDTGDTGTGEPLLPEAFVLDPGEVALGDATQAELTAMDVLDFDHTLITEVTFTGELVLCALDLQPDGATLSFAAPALATPGPAHLMVDLGELGVVTVRDAVNVVDSGDIFGSDPDADPCE